MEQEIKDFVDMVPIKEEGTFFFESNDVAAARTAAISYCDKLNGNLIAERDGSLLKMEELKLDLRECSKSSPNTKLYIVYNAHYLRKEVYNAMLKSLEEPNHTIYILISPGSLPPTLLSRSIRFVLRSEIKEENISWEELPQLLNNEHDIPWGKVRFALKSLFISKIDLKDKIKLSESFSDKFFKEKKLLKRLGEEVVKAHILSGAENLESTMDCKPFFASGSHPNLTMFYTLFKS